jgi:Domain of unknown function (DUF5130)
VTAGEIREHTGEQPLTVLDEPGGETISAEPEQTTSEAGAAALDGPFTTRQLLRLDEALRLADQETGLTFSVYVGDLAEPTRQQAEKMHKQLDGADRAVLIAVSPNQRVLEIVTGNEARCRWRQRSPAAISRAASCPGSTSWPATPARVRSPARWPRSLGRRLSCRPRWPLRE